MAELTHEERALLNGNLERIAGELELERRRQVAAEGYTPKSDERHAPHQLTMAAVAYAVSSHYGAMAVAFWPWDPATFKPKDPRRDLVRAGALVMAAIERLDREALAPADVEGA